MATRRKLGDGSGFYPHGKGRTTSHIHHAHLYRSHLGEGRPGQHNATTHGHLPRVRASFRVARRRLTGD